MLTHTEILYKIVKENFSMVNKDYIMSIQQL